MASIHEMCPFAEFGCSYTRDFGDFEGSRKEIQDHIKKEPNKHILIMWDTVLTMKQTGRVIDETVDSMNKKVDFLNANLLNSKKLMGSQFVWKIPQYRSKFHAAKMGHSSAVFSPIFSFARNGYKLIASIWPYGDGNGRGTHLALYVSICKGEFDSLLQWPFHHTITLAIIDQAQDPQSRNNINYVVNPANLGNEAAFLRRPTGERNAAFGAAKLCPMQQLAERDYVRDDTMLIKIEGDVSEYIAV